MAAHVDAERPSDDLRMPLLGLVFEMFELLRDEELHEVSVAACTSMIDQMWPVSRSNATQ